ncbi:MAG: hypothetical protein ACOC6B_06375 [Thermodesulfobacteriota bacterium]
MAVQKGLSLGLSNHTERAGLLLMYFETGQTGLLLSMAEAVGIPQNR